METGCGTGPQHPLHSTTRKSIECRERTLQSQTPKSLISDQGRSHGFRLCVPKAGPRKVQIQKDVVFCYSLHEGNHGFGRQATIYIAMTRNKQTTNDLRAFTESYILPNELQPSSTDRRAQSSRAYTHTHTYMRAHVYLCTHRNTFVNMYKCILYTTS